jgi:hypothetical protein
VLATETSRDHFLTKIMSNRLRIVVPGLGATFITFLSCDREAGIVQPEAPRASRHRNGAVLRQQARCHKPVAETGAYVNKFWLLALSQALHVRVKRLERYYRRICTPVQMRLTG